MYTDFHDIFPLKDKDFFLKSFFLYSQDFDCFGKILIQKEHIIFSLEIKILPNYVINCLSLQIFFTYQIFMWYKNILFLIKVTKEFYNIYVYKAEILIPSQIL